MKLTKTAPGVYEISATSGKTYRLRRLPARSRGWHAELYLGKNFWTATRYSGRTLRAVIRQMAEAGIRTAS